MMRATLLPGLSLPGLSLPGLSLPGLSLLALSLLAGCGASTPARQDPPGWAPCRAEARNDPAAASLRQQSNPANVSNQSRIEREAAEAENRALRACLQRAGIPSSGGVEAPR
ncbi:hypothetical protein C8P66_102100 [Humitalea rosea]|uniref:Uncharacterized protein n=1 Tax=Humitalea rosea TaxID=990373 RepID=A0A2W7JDZ1_9PROT|nr:phosphoribosylamine--glycine ligase [Humitalea rosea]PZW50412.1 hypothetical protein C8P66_102100 [Humitalea rosea]